MQYGQSAPDHMCYTSAAAATQVYTCLLEVVVIAAFCMKSACADTFVASFPCYIHCRFHWLQRYGKRHDAVAGNFSNFLFQLLPRIAIYGPSGANQNFQYCGHTFASLPNGLGFGGQVNYWSLFIDGLFESGMSHKGATFTNPTSLSADTNFQVQHGQPGSACT